MRRQLVPADRLDGHLHGAPRARVPARGHRHRPARASTTRPTARSSSGTARRSARRSSARPSPTPKGNPLPEYFQSRPSAAVRCCGNHGGGIRPDAEQRLEPRADQPLPGPSRTVPASTTTARRSRPPSWSGSRPTAKLNGLDDSTPVPVDAVTASASGLDPHISVANARLQAARVADERGLTVETVLALVDDHTSTRTLGFLGEKRSTCSPSTWRWTLSPTDLSTRHTTGLRRHPTTRSAAGPLGGSGVPLPSSAPNAATHRPSEDLLTGLLDGLLGELGTRSRAPRAGRAPRRGGPRWSSCGDNECAAGARWAEGAIQADSPGLGTIIRGPCDLRARLMATLPATKRPAALGGRRPVTRIVVGSPRAKSRMGCHSR